MDPFLGQIIMFGGNFAPKGWRFCDGSMLSVSANTALFSVIGTIYGGDGQTNFALPDLRGRAPIQAGQAPGLAMYHLGSSGGSEQQTLTVNQMPRHNHSMHGELASADKKSPQGNMLALVPDGRQIYAEPIEAEDRTLADSSIGQSGGNAAFDIRGPYLTTLFIIAVEGVYPSRP